VTYHRCFCGLAVSSVTCVSRWFRSESVVRRVFLGMVSRYFVKKAKELMGQGIPDGISTICRLVIGVSVSTGSNDIVALIDSFKARDLAMRKAKVLQAGARRLLERSRHIDFLSALKIVAACRRYHLRHNYLVKLVSSHVAAMMKQLCIRSMYQKRLGAGSILIMRVQSKRLSLRHSSVVCAATLISSAAHRALANAPFNRLKRAAMCIAPWGAAATVRRKWVLVRASMVIARRLLTSITCWRWKSIYSVAVLKSRLSSWIFRKRFSALRKCARSLQVMCLWLLARRRACITLQHAVRCHRSRSKIAQLVEARAKLISKFLRRRKLELVNASFKVVSLHTAKEVSDLYVHSKSAAEIENERRPWRRLKRTALRDAEALAESVIGIPAEDLRRRFRGVIGRRVLVTLSSIANMDEGAPELLGIAQNPHSAADALKVCEQTSAASNKQDAAECSHTPHAEVHRHLVTAARSCPFHSHRLNSLGAGKSSSCCGASASSI
jgi:hypothetical protein